VSCILVPVVVTRRPRVVLALRRGPRFSSEDSLSHEHPRSGSAFLQQPQYAEVLEVTG
jgi:hypothetical protein